MLRGQMIGWIKRTLIELTSGAALGFVGWCLMGKRLTSMIYGTPGGSFSCQVDVEQGLDRFVAMQLYSAIGGALIAFLGMLILRRWWAKARTKPGAPTPGLPGTPAS